MKKLLFVFLLISPFSFADWGDVYYCQTTSVVEIKVDGIVEQYKPQTFQFKLDEAKNSIVFGKSGFFGNNEFPLNLDKSHPIVEFLVSSNPFTTIVLNGRSFMSSHVKLSESVVSITADCDRFE